MPRYKSFILPVLVLALALPIAGCGGSEEAAEKAAEKAIEAQTGDKVDIETGKDGKDSVTIKDKNGTSKFSTGTELPDNWPKELALPEGVEPLAVSEMEGPTGPQQTVSANTEMSVKDAAQHFDDQLSGWKKTSGNDFSSGDGSLSTRTYEDGGNKAIITIGDGSGKTSITIAYSTAK